MKKLNLVKNTKLLIVLLSVLLVSLSGCGKEESKGKYIVWVGGEFVAAGYHTDEYKKNDDGMLEFVLKRSGKKKIVPVCSVTDIDVNTKAN